MTDAHVQEPGHERVVPFSAAMSGAPVSTGVVYFALKSQNAAGLWSALSNNAYWPQHQVYLPLVMR